MDTLFELSASVALWRGNELLLMKRSAGAFGGGGWFLPGGHVEPGERPAAACVRELWEETGIVLKESELSLADVMTYEHAGATAHTLVYNATSPAAAEPAINDEHVVAKWYEPEAAIARFFEAEMLRGRGVAEKDIALAGEVARVIQAALRARGMRGPGDRAAEERPTNW
jgi:8-oxo-dGTP pyrophosphatase MutT (NUDIX family)